MVGLVADLKKWGQLRQGESEGWVAMGGLVADLKKGESFWNKYS